MLNGTTSLAKRRQEVGILAHNTRIKKDQCPGGKVAQKFDETSNFSRTQTSFKTEKTGKTSKKSTKKSKTLVKKTDLAKTQTTLSATAVPVIDLGKMK